MSDTIESSTSNDIDVKISEIPQMNVRLNELKDYFHTIYDKSPSFYVKVPGRKLIQPKFNGQFFDYNGFYIIILTSMMNKDILKMIFDDCWQHYIINVIVLTQSNDRNNSISIYTYQPFNNGDCSNTTAIELNSYFNNTLKYEIEFFPKKINNLHTCRLSFATFQSKPFIIINSNATKFSTNDLNGIEGQLIKTLSQRMNFTLYPLIPPNNEQRGLLFDNGSATGAIKMILDGTINFTVGGFAYIPQRAAVMSNSFAHYYVSLIFAIPEGEPISSMRKLFYPFHFVTWLYLLITFTMGYFILILLQLNRKHLQIDNINNILFMNMINIFMGGSIHQMASRTFLRVLLTNWFLVCIILRSSYQGSLFSFLQSQVQTEQLDTVEKVFQSKYNIYIFPSYAYQIESFTKDKNRIIMYNTSEDIYYEKIRDGNLKIVLFYNKENIGYYNVCNYRKGIVASTKNRLFLMPMVIYLRKDSYLTEKFSQEIMAFEQSGLFKKWRDSLINDIYFQKQITNEPKKLTCVQLLGAYEICVNLIGEHIDYCGYPVLPMAIQQNILVAVSPNNNKQICLRNINSKYIALDCELTEVGKIIEVSKDERGAPIWYSYFLCGIKGIADEMGIDNLNYGMCIAVSGNIPAASGLSSSSALVSSAVLATSYINSFSLNKKRLSTISEVCERYIGTQGGGMDQAIAFLATKGCAQFIEWDPLRTTPIRLPNESIFVIANSLSEANKAATSDFNERVIECRLACRILAKSKEIPIWKDIMRFSILQEHLNMNLKEFIEFADDKLDKDIYTRKDILNAIQCTENEFETLFLTENTKHMELFKLRQRTLHVLKESGRVLEFCEAAQKGNFPLMSSLMNDSHTSLNEQYECSHPNLNKLVKISNDTNVGARLTGAGWGGCIVALCNSKSSCDAYMNKLRNTYYIELPCNKGINFNEILFATSPQSGAEIFTNL